MMSTLPTSSWWPPWQHLRVSALLAGRAILKGFLRRGPRRGPSFCAGTVLPRAKQAGKCIAGFDFPPVSERVPYRDLHRVLHRISMDSRRCIDLQYYCSDAIKSTIFPMFFESSLSEPKSGFANVFTGETWLLGDILTLLVGVRVPAP
jgi:hypothetical protein